MKNIPANIELRKKTPCHVDGQHIISLCNIESEEAQKIQSHIVRCIADRNMLMKLKEACILEGERLIKALHKQWEEYNYWINKLHKLFLVDQVYVHNITTTVGRTAIANRLGGGASTTGQINYGALGDDNTAEVVGDTTLGNEVYRKALSSGTNVSNAAYVENFYTATETTGTYEEYGFFIDGTGVADSGTLFNRFTQQITKSNVETLNVQSIITVNDS